MSRRRHRHESPERRIYRLARRRANAKLSCMTHLVTWAATVLFLMAISFRMAVIVGAAWGIGIALHWFAVMVAPGMRDQFLDRELRRRGFGTRDEEEAWDDAPYPPDVLEELSRLERGRD